MKLRSVKAMAFWFVMATMASSAPIFAHSSNPKDCPTAHQVRETELPGIAALNAIGGNFLDFELAQAVTRLNGGNPDPAANPYLAALLDAEMGVGPGSAGEAAARFAVILASLNVPQTAIQNFITALQAFFTAGTNYGNTVAITPADIAGQTAAFAAWQASGNALVLTIFALDTFHDEQKSKIETQVSELVVNLGQAILGDNLLISPPFPADIPSQLNEAVLDDQQAHQNLTELARIIIHRLVRLQCRG